MMDKDIEEQIKQFLTAKSKLIQSVNLDTNLFSEGILDSLAFIELIDYVENEYKISLNEEGDINPETFGTISQISKIISLALEHQKK